MLKLDTLPRDKEAAADTAVHEDCNSPKVKWYNAKLSEGTCLVCFQEKYCKVFIAIVVDENVRATSVEKFDG